MKTITKVLIALNILFLSSIAILFYIISSKSQTPAALIAPHITMGKIILKVANIHDMESFYSQLLGMQVISKDQKQVALG